jgi:hypothetical protein
MGLLFGPGDWKNPTHYLPYALDNGAFPAWRKGLPWDEEGWLRLMDRAAEARTRPLWAVVPDVVTNREATLERWHKYAPMMKERGLPLAIAVQDGMTAEDVPEDATVVFVGGSTEWKWRTLPRWTARFKRVHVGRVNTLKWLIECEDLGVESVDGTGWFRGDPEQTRELIRWVTGTVSKNLRLFFNDDEDAEALEDD